ncbi:uncharacterized protein METZ01_LOCUS335699, partial [marine metagenome]
MIDDPAGEPIGAYQQSAVEEKIQVGATGLGDERA